jgi:hypothetical protein
MTETGKVVPRNLPSGKVKAPFFQIGGEVSDVFLPLMGAACLTVYSHLKRMEYKNPKLKHTVRKLADATALGIATVSRSLEILEHLGLAKLIRFGGSKESECQLLDSWVVANRLGATYDKRTHSYTLPPEVAQRLKAEVNALREKQQGRMPQSTPRGTPRTCGNRLFSVSQRNASVSQTRRQRSTRETQTGSPLIRKERRTEEGPSPTPSHKRKVQKTKDSPDEDEPEELTRWARIKFTGVMKDMGNHILDTSRPPIPHHVNGAADWEEFGFNSLAVEAATWHGGALALTFSASDPEIARRALEKYHRTFDASLRAWYECKVKIFLVKAQR